MKIRMDEYDLVGRIPSTFSAIAMLEVLPLPLVWLGAFCLGQALTKAGSETHRRTIAAVSITAIFLGCGWKEGILYFSLGAITLLAAQLMQRLEDWPRTLVYVVSVAGAVVVIAGFLRFRFYILKYFVYLPSLSYLGFRGIAYLTSVYRKQEHSVSSAALQLFFFPMLFTGPISRTENFSESKFDYPQALRRLILGLAMLTLGYLLKPYIIPEFILLRSYAEHIPPEVLWRGMIAISFELYFTFAGYSHLVIGLGLLLGFQLPENFDNPYLATSIGEFWRKWHMSLSFWIRDYLYIPLGGNRKGLFRKCLNLLFAMSICGIWHGLTLNFLLWGLYHGALLSIESVCREFKFEPLSKLPNWLSKPIRVVRTFALVTFGWLLFMYSTRALEIYLNGMVP